MRIYISGPITGIDPVVAYRWFLNAEWKIQELGHIAVNPLKIGSFLKTSDIRTTWMSIWSFLRRWTRSSYLKAGRVLKAALKSSLTLVVMI